MPVKKALTAKAKVLNFGKLGFRKSTKLVTLKGWTWARVGQKIEELELTNLLKIKKSVDKEAVKNSGRTKAEMREFGVEITTDEEFFYEVDEAKIAEMPGMNVVRKTA